MKKARDTYASYALSYLNNGGKVTGSDLDSLGVCFASNIPASRLLTMSNSEFMSRISYFIGNQHQPNLDSSKVLATLIKNLLSDYDVDDLILNKLKDVSVYASDFSGLSTVTNFFSFNYFHTISIYICPIKNLKTLKVVN